MSLNLSLKNLKAENIFENGVLLSKFSLIITLLVFSYINADTSFVCNNPKDFLTESILVGLCTAIPTILIAYNRSSGQGILNVALLTFLVFFIFNFLMEFSGLNNNTTNISLSDKQQQATLNNLKSILWLKIILGILFIIMTFLAFKVCDWNIGYKTILLELFIFGFFNAIPPIIIGQHRNQNTNQQLTTFASSFALFGGLYFGLQTGGFFTNVFSH